MPIHKTRKFPPGPRQSPTDLARLLSIAHTLQHNRYDLHIQPSALLRDTHLCVLHSTLDDASVELFRRAAEELGAHVAIVPAVPLLAPKQVPHIAHMFRRLYHAVECQGLPPFIVQQISVYTGIPVYRGIATPTHPCSRLAAKLDHKDPMIDNRHFIIQAVLLDSLT